MARGQHTNVIEPPKRTAHNIAYWSERLIEVALFTCVFIALIFARSWPLPTFMFVVCICMVVCTAIPTLVGGRIVDFVAQTQETLIESDRGVDQK